MQQALTIIRLKRQAITIALPPPEVIASPDRSSSDRIYVLFEDIDDASQRQYTITLQEDSPYTWRMITQTVPPVVGHLLVTIGGTRHFVAAFTASGEARIEGMPSDLILDPTGPDMEIAVLPPNSHQENQVGENS
ncbi:MAG: hypothetical protein HGA19_06605 [Oscillochloris sp.]|nr:hypothetical protein [Oscillochloris sp.]